MATFKDNNGREWDIRIDAPAIMAVRDSCDEKFMRDSSEENTFARLADDPVLLCRVLYVLCAQQRQAKGVSEAEFYAGLAGDSIDAATQAMLQAIVSFTPRRTRELIAVSAEKATKIRDLAMARAIEKINDPALEARLLAQIDAEVDRILGGTTQPQPATD